MVVNDPPTVGRTSEDKSEKSARIVIRRALKQPAPEHYGGIII